MDNAQEGEKIPFYRKPFIGLAGFIIDSLDGRKRSGENKSSAKLKGKIRILYPEMEEAEAVRSFRVQRLSLALLVLFCGLGLSAAVYVRETRDSVQIENNHIVRGSYMEGDKEVVLSVRHHEKQQDKVHLILGDREYTYQEADLLASQLFRQLPELILGENCSLERVEQDLVLSDAYEGYPFTVSWYSGGSGVINQEGKLQENITEPVWVCLEAELWYGDWEWEEEFAVQINPGKESLHKSLYLQQYLTDSEVHSRTREAWELPQEWKGSALEYEVIEDTSVKGLLLLFGVTAVVVYVLAEKDLEERYQRRQQQMQYAYPELVHKLLLYLGAGLTIRGSLEIICRDKRIGCLQELEYTCRELRTGVPEVQAYTNWGKRVGLREYVQLSALLVQNLQKGSGTLLARLKEETDRAWQEYLRQCKKRSEEAATKLLLPMVMMLVVVMLMILIPAFSASGV